MQTRTWARRYFTCICPVAREAEGLLKKPEAILMSSQYPTWLCRLHDRMPVLLTTPEAQGAWLAQEINLKYGPCLSLRL